MAEEFDGPELIGIFLAEARASVETLHAAFNPPEGLEPRRSDLRNQYILAHNLRGSASMYGFPGLAGLAEVLEAALEQAPEISEAAWPQTIALLRDLLEAIRNQVDAIGEQGNEDGDCLEAWHARYPQPAPTPAPPQPDAASAVPLSDEYLLPELDSEVFSYFATEAQEYLSAMETSLLRLEKDPEDRDTIQQLFRSAHTLKGAAYTVGFQAVGDITHHVEDIMGAMRDGQMRMTPDLTDLMFRAVDVVRLLMRRDPRALDQTRREFAVVKERLQQADQMDSSADHAPVPAVTPSVGAASGPASARSSEAPAADTPQPAATPPPSSTTQEVSDSAMIRVSRERLERLLNLVGELVIGRGRLEQRLLMLEQLSHQVQGCKVRMIEAVRAFEEKHTFTVPSAGPGNGESGGPLMNALMDFGSLEFDKYDDFNILARRIAEVSADVGESMAQLSGSIRKAREDMSHLQRLTLGMRDEIAHARMVPIGTPFTRFRRAAREMARTSGKEVTVVVSGEHTEVDTGVVDRLVDPLVHLVRNAVFHGIEKPAVRVGQGKPASGTIWLRAAHRGNSVAIEVEDDGAGIDVDSVKAKAIRLGVLRPELAPVLPEPEALKLIFLPGFSTSEEVGTQAGRGVGLDVVKRIIEAMHGHIEIETSRGKGTKFRLTLPLTVLISMALVVRVANDRYAIPLPGIREVLMCAREAIKDFGGRSILQVGEEAVEVRPLAQMLGGDLAEWEGPRPVVIVRTPTGALGLVVDQLLGRQEIVIKTLGSLKLFQESCFGGATIDPEGRVILVLDVGRLGNGEDRHETIAAGVQSAGLALEGPSGGPEPPPFELEEEGPQILLVDDSLSVRKFVGRMLEGAGYQVDTAVDGEEGLRKALHHAYRLIITDLEMPKLNGYEVIQALRERPHTKTTPILVMTTRAGEKHRQMALSMGANAYIAKPVEERALVQEVERWIGRPMGAQL